MVLGATAEWHTLGNVGGQVVCKRDDRVRWLFRRGRSRSACLGRPRPQVLEHAPDNQWIVDQGNDTHRSLVFGTFERIGLVDLADDPRPVGLAR
jgi:hypothetical protein